ncbi:hypothetical protein P7D05_23810 [Bacillus paranthracis]|nr:hypothetical protein AT271_15045 [Bacillus cereus]MDG1605790.1 hypothetical protein [Bacillus paranthracis]
MAEKVKELLLLPNLEVATTKQVAEFYDVPLETIKTVVKDNKEELKTDGYITMPGIEIRDILDSNKLSLSKIKPRKGHFAVRTETGEVKIAYRSTAMFPKRAILRVGMLLKGSEVAKEVRTQLLNIEEPMFLAW